MTTPRETTPMTSFTTTIPKTTTEEDDWGNEEDDGWGNEDDDGWGNEDDEEEEDDGWGWGR